MTEKDVIELISNFELISDFEFDCYKNVGV